MELISYILQICVICHSVAYVQCYVLFAANVEDFKRIAEKLGSEKLMNQLLDVPHDPALNHYKKDNARNDRVDNSENNVGERDKYIKKPVARQSEPKSSLNLKDDVTKIDFEELVERVKQRLENEFKNKYKNQVVRGNKQNTNIKTVNTKGHIQMRPKKKITLKHNANIKSTIRSTTDAPLMDDNNYDYEDAIPENDKQTHQRINDNIEPNDDKRVPMYAEAMLYETDVTKSPKINIKYELQHNKSKIYYDNTYDYDTEDTTDANGQDDLPFKQIQMIKEDSYGDYITPAKERNIYASKETTAHSRYRIRNNRLIRTTEYKTQTDKNDYVDAVTVGSQEIKARTEKLWYDDNADQDTRIVSDERFRGTGVPTRETYKIITPNYYASLPTIAERYDFNEPLPERDRERENVKYIGNPPARINKKIRL